MTADTNKPIGAPGFGVGAKIPTEAPGFGVNPKDAIGVTKAPMNLVPFTAIVAASIAMLDGKLKYGAYNWRQQPVQAMIYADAAKRHIDAWINGQETASDSRAHHLGHAIACMAILIDAQSTKNLFDDRPPKLSEEDINRIFRDASDAVTFLTKKHPTT